MPFYYVLIPSDLTCPIENLVFENKVTLENDNFLKHLKRYFHGKNETVGTTLETSGKDVKIHSKRVGKMWKYTRNEWRRWCQVNRVELLNLISQHMKNEEQRESLNKITNDQNFDFNKVKTTLVSIVFLHLLHSFRVYFFIFSTHFECILISSPLVSSVFFRF